MNDSRDETDSEAGVGRNLSQKFLTELFKKEWKLYYRTPELNDKLYLHYKGTKPLMAHRVQQDSEHGAVHWAQVPLL